MTHVISKAYPMHHIVLRLIKGGGQHLYLFSIKCIILLAYYASSPLNMNKPFPDGEKEKISLKRPPLSQEKYHCQQQPQFPQIGSITPGNGK
jgi:hypothetical protein